MSNVPVRIVQVAQQRLLVQILGLAIEVVRIVRIVVIVVVFAIGIEHLLQIVQNIESQNSTTRPPGSDGNRRRRWRPAIKRSGTGATAAARAGYVCRRGPAVGAGADTGVDVVGAVDIC